MESFAELKKFMHRHRTRKSARVFALLTCTGMACSAVIAAQSSFADDTAFAQAQRRIDIGNGQHFNLYCTGTGTPTVVFESGIGDWGFSWAMVQPSVARLTQTCTYDRAGLGFSDAARRASTSSHMVDDLHSLLQIAHVAPPYVLVGHSLGGLNVRLYADRFREEVVGMVLVDPTHEDGIRRIDAQKNNQESRRYALEIARAKSCLRKSQHEAETPQFRTSCIEPDDPAYSTGLNDARVQIARKPSYQRAQLSEITNYANGTSFAEVRAARRWFGALPLVVLTASRTTENIGPEWPRFHQELAALSRLGVQCTVTNSGHYIQRDQPKIVIAAISQVLVQARQLQLALATDAGFDYTLTPKLPLTASSCPDQRLDTPPP